MTDVKAYVKTGLRRAIRSRGYDLVPTAGGISHLQGRLMQDTPTVLDVGANVGQYAERLRDLGVDSRIISFEPGSRAYGTLARKASKASSRWDARNVALSSEAGTANLRVSANSVSSSLLDVAEAHLQAAPASRTQSTEEVRVSTLDAELDGDAGYPYWLKLDVQGLELRVLEGASRTLTRTRAIQAEVSFAPLYSGQTDWLELCRHLTEAGFLFRYMQPGYEDASTGFMLQADVLFVREERLRG